MERKKRCYSLICHFCLVTVWNYHWGFFAKKLLAVCPWQAVMIMGVTYLSGSFPHTPPPAQPHPCSESQSWRAALCPHNVWSYAVLTWAEMSVNAFVFLIWSAQHYLFEVLFKGCTVPREMACQCNDESQRGFSVDATSLYCESLSASDQHTATSENNTHHGTSRKWEFLEILAINLIINSHFLNIQTMFFMLLLIYCCSTSLVVDENIYIFIITNNRLM